MPREPENVAEVFLGSAGQALEQIGQMYPQHQAGKRQALLNAFSMQMKVEAADTEKALAGERMSHLAALTRLADLRGEEVIAKTANFLPEIEELEAKSRLKREELEHSMGLGGEAVSAPGEPGEGVVIPSGVKVWERPTPEVSPEEKGIAAAETEAAKTRRLQEIGVPTRTGKFPNVVKQIRDTYNKELKTWNAERRAWEKEQEPSMMEKLTDKASGEIAEKEEYPVPKPTLAEVYETYYRDYIIAQGLDSDSVATALGIGKDGQDLIGPPTPEAYDLKAIEAWANREIEGWDKLDALTKQKVREQRRQELLEAGNADFGVPTIRSGGRMSRIRSHSLKP